MICYQSMDLLCLAKDTVVSTGKFDGLHKGHMALISEMKAHAAEGLDTLVLRIGAEHDEDRSRLLTETETRKKLMEAGIGHDLSLSLSGAFREMTREAFAYHFLPEKLRAKTVISGEDFRFGKGAEGNADFLREAGRKAGYRVILLPDLMDEGEKISSTMIRRLLCEGSMERANRCLGYTYSISGTVIRGRGLARVLGYPTLNILPPAKKALPGFGVYRTLVRVGRAEYTGLANIGVKPTVTDENEVLLEVHLLGFSGDLYGREAEVYFEEFLRPEQKFGGIQELKEQMDRDIRRIS